MPAVSDINTNPYKLFVYTNDQYNATIGNKNLTYDVYIHPNRAPVLNGVLSDVTYHAGETINYIFPDDLFIDPDGETITYEESYSSSATDPSSWLSFDNATRKFSGLPPVNSAVGDYIINVYAKDGNTNSNDGHINFTISITENFIPQIDQGLPAATPVPVFHEFIYTIPTDAFKDPENDPITIRVELVPPDFTITYTPGDRTVRGTLSDNTKFGDFTLKFYIEDNWNISTFTQNLPIRIDENLAPVISYPASDPS